MTSTINKGCVYHNPPVDGCFECARVYVINEISWIDSVILLAEKEIDAVICRMLQQCEDEYDEFWIDVICTFKSTTDGERLRGTAWEAVISSDKKSITFSTAHHDEFGGRYTSFHSMWRLDRVSQVSTDVKYWPMRD